MKKYDLLIIGSGLFGATFANIAKNNGRKCLVIDKRKTIGGNVYCEKINNILIHKYGPHIFHTSDEKIWKFVNNFTKFKQIIHTPYTFYRNKYFPMPFNMYLFQEIYKTKDIEKIKKIIKKDKIKNPKNLKEQAISTVGKKVYNTIIKGYTEKQWGTSAKKLPSLIIKRLPIRFNYNRQYFDDKYIAIPEKGYNELIKNMLSGIEVKTDADYFKNEKYFKNIAKKIIFTGKIDEFYHFKFGKLDYRSLRFENKFFNTKFYQKYSVINYSERKIPYTRSIEYKYLHKSNSNKTIVVYEYPENYSQNNEPYYPINNTKNQKLYNKYKQLSKSDKNIIFGGRLGEYKYYDMDDCIESAGVVCEEVRENS